MGLGDSVKEAYFAGEDKWYAFWDRVDSKIPVYGIIERIDKVIPSFILFLIILAIIIVFAGWWLLGSFFAQSVFLVRVMDSAGNPLPNAMAEVYLGEQALLSEATNEFGETKEIAVPLGSVVSVSVDKENFASYSDEITVNKARTEIEVFLSFIEDIEDIVVLIKNEYNQPVLEPVVISFSCKNPSVRTPSEMTVSNARATIAEPKNCNGLIASFESSNYQKKNSVELNPGQNTVFMNSIESEFEEKGTGTLRIQLKSGSSLIDESLTVYLYKDNGADGIGPIDTKDSLYGIAEFEKASGKYFVKTSANENFAQAVSGIAEIKSGETTTINLELENNSLPDTGRDARIRIQLKDKTSLQIIPDASLTLKKEFSEIETKTSDENGITEFFVSEDTEYSVFIDAEEYCFKVLSGIKTSETLQIIELEKFTSTCGADLKVRVRTQDGKPVKNAVVGLYNEDGYNTGFATRVSDINGEVIFTRVPTGSYKAFANKGNYSGWSDLDYFQQRNSDETVLSVTMFVPNGTLSIKVTDKEGNALPGANILFMDATTLEKIGGGTRPVEDLNGIVDFVSKADKRVYFIVSKSGYSNYTSVVYPVLPNTVQEIHAVLEEEIISGDIEIEFLGLYKGDDSATVLASGEEYTARLKIKVPKNSDYSRLGLHLRTGTSSVMELDSAVLEEINVFGRPGIIKGSSYRPSNNYSQDIENITAGNAKWINVEWQEFTTGIIMAEAKLRVKQTALPSDEIVFWYRTWAVDASGNYLRDKEDRELGNSENTGQKQALYADAYQAIYNIGTETLCDGTFCFSAEILDIEEGISEQATTAYNAKLFRDYLLNFTILNVSPRESDSFFDADILIMNEDESLLFEQYSISTAENDIIEGNSGSYEIDWTNVGDFLPNTSVKGALNFYTEKTNSAIIKFRIRSAQRIVFEKTINIEIAAKKELSATVAPEVLPNGIENKIVVTVTDKDSGQQIEDALVKIMDKFKNVLSTARTNSKGIALLTLPAQQPGETLKVLVEKPEYLPFEKEIGVDDQIAQLKPEKIGIALNTKTKTEAEEPFAVENRSGIELTIKNLELKGKLEGLVDAQKAANWLDTFLGEKIPAKQEKEFSIKAALTEAGKKIEQTKSIEATLIVTLGAMGGEWVYEVPVAISIGLGGEVDNPNCFKITKHEWRATTEGQPVEIEFEVQNNCAVNGNPVGINDIEAQINWKSNEIGIFSITSEETQADLVSGYFKRLVGRLGPEEKMSITLTFSPSAASNAIADADILFRASNPTETASQYMIDKLNAQIMVTNLIDCIAFDNEIITIPPEGTGVFTIETLGCGGKTEFSLESELDLSAKELVLQDKDSAQVQIFAQGEIPGQYLVGVYAKIPGETAKRFIKNLRARHQSDGCIEINKFEFDIYKNPENPYSGYDTAVLTNHCYDYIENIEVVWSEKDLDKAMEDGMMFAAIMGMANMMSQTSRLAPSPQQTFEQARTGQLSDICMGDDLKLYYKQNGRFYDEAGNPVSNSPGVCSPFTSVTTSSGQSISGFIKGNQIIDRSGNAVATNSGQGWVLSGVPTAQPSAETPAEKPKTPTTNPSKASTAGNASMSVISFADETAENAGTGTNTDNSGQGNNSGNLENIVTPNTVVSPIRGPLGTVRAINSGTYAGPPELREPKVSEERLASESEKKNEEDEEELDMLGIMAGPMMMGFMQMGGGEPNFMASAIQGFLMGTQWAYGQQKEGEFFYEEILDDMKYKTSKLLLPSAKIEEDNYSEDYSEDIVMEDLKEVSLEPREDYPNLSQEIRKMAFINSAGIEQKNAEQPFFRILQIRGERIEYVTQYEYDEEQKPKTIRVEKRTKYVENFRLQFNAYNPVLEPRLPGPIPNCQYGTLSGVTGKEAVPKVLFEWDWKAIKENSCNEDNSDNIYCDATQFSIAVLKKTDKIREFIQEHKPFACPTGESAASVTEQLLSDTAYDTGITKLQVQKTGTDANIVATLESNNQRNMSGSLEINLLDSNNDIVDSETVGFELLSKAIVSHTFEDVPEGDYTVEAVMGIDLCNDCENNDLFNDSLKAALIMTERGTAKCEPYSTIRLKDFLEASEFSGNASWTQKEKEEILEMLSFNATLIKDAYPKDFRNDFHEFCLHNAFFDCPEFYSKQAGLGEFFSSENNFVFDYGMNPNAPLSPGTYNVRIDIEFDNENWEFFENESPNATITVKMSHLENPRLDNPFYYLPFDGKIGIDSANGRQGYGVNFKQAGEDTININNSSSQLVRTTPIASSTPAYGAWVSGGLVTNFKALNLDNRAIIMDVRATDDATGITLSPSYATPVIMNVSRDKGESAYGFYTIEIDSAPQTTSAREIPWNGIGVNCKDFHDIGMTDAWQNTWDTHGGITGNLECAVGTEITDYGIEWCNPTNTGNVYLWSIVFTPQNKNSIMKRKAFADNMKLIGIDTQGAQISLNGVPGQKFNSYGVSSIQSVQDVLDLVEEERICVIGANNRVHSQFFWNPKPIIDALDSERQQFETQCIPAE